jgi:hypothetical protein
MTNLFGAWNLVVVILFIAFALVILNHSIYPVRNNVPLLPPGQRPSGPAAAAELRFNKIPAGFNASLEFLTGFTWIGRYFHHRLR